MEASWFLSNQYNLQFQMVGLSKGPGVAITRGSTDVRSFGRLYFRLGRMIAAHAVNRPTDFLGAKAIFQAQLMVSLDMLADKTKEIAARRHTPHSSATTTPSRRPDSITVAPIKSLILRGR